MYLNYVISKEAEFQRAFYLHYGQFLDLYEMEY